MTWLEAALWGLAGGFVVEGLDLHTAVRRHGTWPWRVTGPGPAAGVTAYVVAEFIRLLVGGVLAAGAAASGQVSGAVAAMAIGVATPTVVERLTALIPLPATPSPESPSLEPPAPVDPPGAVAPGESTHQASARLPARGEPVERGQAAREAR